MGKRSITEEMPFNGPGVAPVKIKAIDQAAIKYVNIRDERMQLTEKECELRATLIEVVHGHADAIGKNEKGEIVYKFDDLIVTLKPGKDKVKVRSADSQEEGDDE